MYPSSYFSQYTSPNITIVPTVPATDDPPNKKPKLDATPEIPSIKEELVRPLPNLVTVFSPETHFSSVKSKSWASNYLQSIGCEKSLRKKKNNTNKDNYKKEDTETDQSTYKSDVDMSTNTEFIATVVSACNQTSYDIENSIGNIKNNLLIPQIPNSENKNSEIPTLKSSNAREDIQKEPLLDKGKEKSTIGHEYIDKEPLIHKEKESNKTSHRNTKKRTSTSKNEKKNYEYRDKFYENSKFNSSKTNLLAENIRKYNELKYRNMKSKRSTSSSESKSKSKNNYIKNSDTDEHNRKRASTYYSEKYKKHRKLTPPKGSTKRNTIVMHEKQNISDNVKDNDKNKISHKDPWAKMEDRKKASINITGDSKYRHVNRNDDKKNDTRHIRSAVQITEKYKLVNSPIHDIPKNIDLRTVLSRKNDNTNTKIYKEENSCETKHKFSINPPDNLIIKVDHSKETKMKKETKKHNKMSKDHKTKSINLVINIIYKGKDSPSESDNCDDEESDRQQQTNVDLSFLDDFDVDEIVESLNYPATDHSKLINLKTNLHNNIDKSLNKETESNTSLTTKSQDDSGFIEAENILKQAGNIIRTQRFRSELGRNNQNCIKHIKNEIIGSCIKAENEIDKKTKTDMINENMINRIKGEDIQNLKHNQQNQERFIETIDLTISDSENDLNSNDGEMEGKASSLRNEKYQMSSLFSINDKTISKEDLMDIESKMKNDEGISCVELEENVSNGELESKISKHEKVICATTEENGGAINVINVEAESKSEKEDTSYNSYMNAEGDTSIIKLTSIEMEPKINKDEGIFSKKSNEDMNIEINRTNVEMELTIKNDNEKSSTRLEVETSMKSPTNIEVESKIEKYEGTSCTNSEEDASLRNSTDVKTNTNSVGNNLPSYENMGGKKTLSSELKVVMDNNIESESNAIDFSLKVIDDTLNKTVKEKNNDVNNINSESNSESCISFKNNCNKECKSLAEQSTSSATNKIKNTAPNITEDGSLKKDFAEKEKKLANAIENIINKAHGRVSQCKVTSLIRKGRFSKIFKCKTSTGSKIAAKILNLKNSKDKMKMNMLMDLGTNMSRHQYSCVHIIDIYSPSAYLFYVMDYYPKNLEQALKENNMSFHINVVQNLSTQLISAVKLLRAKSLVHLGIQPSHILLNISNDRLKLCGFDSMLYIDDVINLLPNIGKVNYRAPELILGYPASFGVDVWASGLVMYEMATNTQLFPGIYNNDILYKQMCTLGNIPFEMVMGSNYKQHHFCGTNFKRIKGFKKKEIYIRTNFMRSNRIENTIYQTYQREWNSDTKAEQEADNDKLTSFYYLLLQMLEFHPVNRLPIEFVDTHPFIYPVIY